MITIENLNFKIKNKAILEDINIKINSGEKVAIVGGNGAGKTTLVESILNINTKYTGNIKFDFEYKDSPLEKIGVQFQDSNYPVGLSVRDIIEFFSEKGKVVDKAFQKQLIDKFEMNDFLDKDSSKISGGQAQKLNVLLSLISKPKILVMDELTTGLDVFSRNSITAVVEEYIKKNKATLILVTHTASEIERFIDRVIVLKQGKIIDKLDKTKIIKDYKNVGNFLNQLH